MTISRKHESMDRGTWVRFVKALETSITYDMVLCRILSVSCIPYKLTPAPPTDFFSAKRLLQLEPCNLEGLADRRSRIVYMHLALQGSEPRPSLTVALQAPSSAPDPVLPCVCSSGMERFSPSLTKARKGRFWAGGGQIWIG